MIISRKRHEEIVARRLQEEERRREIMVRIELLEANINRRMDRMQRQIDDIREAMRRGERKIPEKTVD